jgi:hypothetical protein
MDISGVSDLSGYLIQQGTGAKGAQVQQAIQVAVLKQTMDQQKIAGQALVEMIESTPSPDGLGNHVDIRI